MEGIEISWDQPLPFFNLGECKAYVAKNLAAPQEQLLALQTSGLPYPRAELFKPYMKLSKNLGLQLPFLSLVGVKNIAQAGQPKSHVLIYRRPNGQKVFPADVEKIIPWHESDLISLFLKPSIEFLQHLHLNHLTHRSIRPDNLFFHEDSASSPIILGDCLAVPPALHQPSLFEPVSLGMVTPLGRGAGDEKADLYALGVTLIALLKGEIPCKQLDQTTLLRRRIEQGSLHVLTENMDVSTHLTHFLKGVLNDNWEEQWGLGDVREWLLESRTRQLLQNTTTRKAERPIKFMDYKGIFQPKILSYHLQNQPTEAGEFIKKPDLEAWLKNGLSDRQRLSNLRDISHRLENSPHSDDKLMVVMKVLDPEAPVVWGREIFTLLGIGPLLHHAIISQQDTKKYEELIGSMGLFLYMYLHQGPSLVTFNRLQPLLKKATEVNSIGYGIERCLYLLMPGLACQSPLIRHQNATNLHDLMLALNSVSEIHWQNLPLDHHIGAFLTIHYQAMTQEVLKDLRAGLPEIRTLALLRIFANIQLAENLPKLEGLAGWFLGHTKTIIKCFHSRKTQESLQAQLEKIKEKGSLVELSQLLDNRRLLEVDQLGAKKARSTVGQIDFEMTNLIKNLNQNPPRSLIFGRQLASVIAGGTALIFYFWFLMAKFLT